MSIELLQWYDQIKRDLPWRTDQNPYKIWLSEIMLQQTQVATVINYYTRFIQIYPTVFHLAAASEDDVFKLWEGLGYYSRARNLLKCAKEVVAKYKGIFPKDRDTLQTLPGIGPYTAGAISSIAFNQKVPAIDGNVLRVISRLHTIDLPINQPKNHSVFHIHVMALMTTRPGDFNQALMELGAMVCTPTSPKCDVCPISMQCKAFQSNRITDFPVKIKSPKKRLIKLAICVILYGEDLLLIKHNEVGLLQGLWGFPRVEIQTGEAPHQVIRMYLEEQMGVDVSVLDEMIGKKHVFTHLIWEPTLYFITINEKIHLAYPEIEWVKLSEVALKALPTAFKKQMPLIEAFMNNQSS